MKTMQERADDVLAQGCLTYSKRADQFIRGITPTHITHGESCYVYDEMGERYMDMVGGLGSTIIDNRNNYCLPTVSEVVLAEKVRELVPCCEKLRFLKTGSEACQAAVRIARAYQESKGAEKGKVRGIGNSYDGWHNWRIAAEKPGAGTNDEGFVKADTNGDVLRGVESGEYGYCILEPVQLDASDGRRQWLLELRAQCDKTETVLIFDEVVSGFRVPAYTVANWWGIKPDLICLGKAMANGAPLSVVGGRREIMDTPDWFVSSTFAGEVSSINAALEIIAFLTPDKIDELWRRGSRLQTQFNGLWKEELQLVGIPTKMVLQGKDEIKAIYWQEMCKQHVIVGKALHVTWSHNDKKIDEFIGKSRVAVERIKAGQKLEGLMPQEIFRRY